jgi:hypothetical protein
MNLRNFTPTFPPVQGSSKRTCGTMSMRSLQMHVPARNPGARAGNPRSLVTGALALALGLAACGGSTTPTAAPSVALTPAPTAPTATKVAVNPTPVAATPTPAPTLQALTLLWQQGGPATPMSSTFASAIDPVTGHLWVSVPFENLYWIFSPDGKYLESWGTAGTGPGQFDFSDHAQTPDGFGAIAFAPDGSFFVGDTGNHRIERFDKNRHFVRAWGTFGTGDGQFVQVGSLTTDGKTVYAGDGGRNDIQAFSADGTFLRSFGGDGGFDALALDLKGRIHATNAQNPVGAAMAMAIFTPDGKQLSSTDLTSLGGWPFAVTVDAAGNTYVGSEMDHFPYTALGIVEIDPAGLAVRTFAGGGDVLTVTPAGDALYVTRGNQLDPTIWTYVRKYALPKS